MSVASDASISGSEAATYGSSGRLHAEAHELEDAAVDDFVVLVHSRGVAEVAFGAVVGIAVVVDAHVVAAVAERPVGREQPRLEVALPRVGHTQPEAGAVLVAAPAGEVGGRHQPGDHRRQRRARVAAGLLPAFLRRRRPARHERVRRLAHAGPRRIVGARELPGEDDREGGLVELDVALVGGTVDVRVLREGPVGLLLVREQPRDGAVGGGAIAGGEQRGDLLVEVAGPHEVIPAAALVGVDRKPPRQRERGDEGAAVGLVLVRLDRHHRDVVLGEQLAGQCRGWSREPAQVAVPLVRVGRCAPGEAGSEARAGGVGRSRGRVAEAEREREGRGAVQGDLPGLQHVPVGRRVVVEVERLVRRQVRPAIAGADEPVRRAHEARGGDQRARHRPVLGQQRVAAAGGGVMPGGVRQRRVEEREQPVAARDQRLERHPHQGRAARRIGDVGLGDAIAAGLGRVDLLVGQRSLVDEPDGVQRVLALAVDERAPVGDRELERAHVRAVAARVVDLAQRTVGERVPDLRVRPHGRAQPLLVARRPVRRGTRSARRRGLRAGGRRRPAHRCSGERDRHRAPRNSSHRSSLLRRP